MGRAEAARPVALFAVERHQVAVYLAGLLAGVGIGVAFPAADRTFEALIYPVLGALLYVTFLQVPFVELRSSLADRRFMAAVLLLNFAAVPVVVWGLTRPLPGDQAVLLGVLLVLLTPCVDYVIVFSGLAGGRAQRLLAAAPVLMLAQIALLPLYLWLFMGSEVADIVHAEPFLEAFGLLIALPLGLAWATEAWAGRARRGARLRAGVRRLPVPLMALTLLVVAASQIPKVEDDLGRVAEVIPVYVAFLVVMALVGRAAARLFALDVPDGRALVFSGATRNSLVVLPLALALPDQLALASVVVVTQTLVELIGMVAYVQLIPRLLPGPGRSSPRRAR
jgi:ACR3 family arsenite efflux pump ArsB